MNKQEAEQFLEELGFCMKHLVRPVKAKGARTESCPECDAEKTRAQESKIEQAVRLLRNQDSTPPTSLELWTPCDPGKFPPVNERVYVICIGFRDTGKAGNKEISAIGRPLYWRKK